MSAAAIGRGRGLLVVLALLLGIVIPSGARAVPSCTPVMAIDDLSPGMTGRGYTVSSGTDPERFDVEILGVIHGGIAPGRDVVVAKVTGPAIERAGGIWAGMSGSPVYVEDNLVGAVAWGFAFGPSSIGGLTAAEDMVDLYATPDADRLMEPAAVDVPDPLRGTIADAAEMSVTQVPADLRRLPVPLSMSGVPTRVVDRMRDALDRTGAGLLPHLGGGAGADEDDRDRPAAVQPGGNLAAVVARGDVTVAAIGTVTDVCGDTAIGFGHPMFHSGRTALGASDADAVAIVSDAVSGSFKLSEVGGPLGTIDEDRLAGLRIELGEWPAATRVTSDVLAVEPDQRRQGRTDVLHDDWLGELAASHVVANVDVTQDRLGPGSALVTFRVTGTRESGGPWALERTNRSMSLGDIGSEVPFELFLDVLFLQHNTFEDVDITGLDVSVEVSETPSRYTLGTVLVSADDGATWTDAPEVSATAGGRLLVRATVRDAIAGDSRDVDLALGLPADAAGTSAMLEVSGGQVSGDPWECLFDPAACAVGGSTSLDELLERLASQPRRDELVATLVLGAGAPEEGAPTTDSAAAQDLERLDQVIEGQATRSIFIETPS